VPLELAVLLFLLVIGLSAAASTRLRVAAPLLLVVLGALAALLPGVPAVQVPPEVVLSGVLPPLLYASAVSLPVMDFRRDFTAISGLSVVLVLVSAVAVGALLALTVPGLGLWWGVALGAVLSPTDAVATSIAKGLGVSPRAVSLLEGEGLLNDATALVLLRTAVAGAAAAVSLGGAVGSFALAVGVALVVGMVVGHLDIAVRRRVQDPTTNTVLSLAVPFAASLPVEALGGSGLVAAVVAGLVTGHHAPRVLSPQARLSDSQTWGTVSLLLEGAVFLLMGLQLPAVLTAVDGAGGRAGGGRAGLALAAGVAAAALALVVAVRAGYVALLLYGARRRARRGGTVRERVTAMQERVAGRDPAELVEVLRVRRAQQSVVPGGRRRLVLGSLRRGGLRGAARTWRSSGRPITEEAVARVRARLRRTLADVDHLLSEPLGWREGVVVVWAGMRGAVTVAAAQTLPEAAPQRDLLVLVAYLVAAASLLLQGLTLRRVVLAVGSTRSRRPDDAEALAERSALMALLADAAASVPAPADGSAQESKGQALARLRAQREALLDARDDGAFSAGSLTAALAVVDADEIGLALRGGPA
jgi:CPA1 family monovalent cation:H+ antiporter